MCLAVWKFVGRSNLEAAMEHRSYVPTSEKEDKVCQ